MFYILKRGSCKTQYECLPLLHTKQLAVILAKTNMTSSCWPTSCAKESTEGVIFTCSEYKSWLVSRNNVNHIFHSSQPSSMSSQPLVSVSVGISPVHWADICSYHGASSTWSGGKISLFVYLNLRWRQGLQPAWRAGVRTLCRVYKPTIRV